MSTPSNSTACNSTAAADFADVVWPPAPLEESVERLADAADDFLEDAASWRPKQPGEKGDFKGALLLGLASGVVCASLAYFLGLDRAVELGDDIRAAFDALSDIAASEPAPADEA